MSLPMPHQTCSLCKVSIADVASVGLQTSVGQYVLIKMIARGKDLAAHGASQGGWLVMYVLVIVEGGRPAALFSALVALKAVLVE